MLKKNSLIISVVKKYNIAVLTEVYTTRLTVNSIKTKLLSLV